MNFTIKKEKLLKLLQIADKAISQFAPNPILKNLLIEIKNNSLVFFTSDSHISIESNLTNKEEFNVEEEGKLLLDEKMISDICRKIDSEDITFESIETDYITVYWGNSKFKLNVESFESYPKIDFGSVNKKFKVNSCTLKTIVEKTAYACSEKEIQLNLTGINLFSKNGKLHALATDRFKFASKEFDINLDEEFNIVVPKKYFISAVQCIDQDEVEIEIQNNKLLFFIDETTIQVELIEDLFPDVSPIFKNTVSSILVIKKSDLQKMIDRCSLIKDEKNKTPINVKVENNKLYISSNYRNSSSNEVQDVISYEGDNINIIYDSKYFIDSLKAIDTENVKIEFTKEKKVAILKNIDDDSLILIIAPQKA